MSDRLKRILIAGVAVVALSTAGAAIAAGGDEPATEPVAASDSAATAGGQGGDNRQGSDDDAGQPAEPEGRDDDAGEADEQVTGSVAERARAAGLRAAGGGKVVELDFADEEDAGYEVDVQRADGTVVEIHLDEGFSVVQDDR